MRARLALQPLVHMCLTMSRHLRRCLPAALLLLAGCYKATFYQSANAIPGAHHEEWTDFFIFGLVGTETFDARQFCREGDLAEIRTGSNFATELVSLLTIGIYTPHKLYVTCAAPDGRERADARRLELWIDAHGRPLRAYVRFGSRTVPTRIERRGAEAFRISLDREAAL